jgi:hypothetical protein
LSDHGLWAPHSRGVLPHLWEAGMQQREVKRNLNTQALLGYPTVYYPLDQNLWQITCLLAIHSSLILSIKTGGFPWVFVSSCLKFPVINTWDKLKDERFILTHVFRGFSPWSTGSIAFRMAEIPWQKHKGVGGSCSPHSRQKAERDRERKGPGSTYTLQSQAPVTHVL